MSKVYIYKCNLCRKESTDERNMTLSFELQNQELVEKITSVADIHICAKCCSTIKEKLKVIDFTKLVTQSSKSF